MAVKGDRRAVISAGRGCDIVVRDLKSGRDRHAEVARHMIET